MKANRQFFIYLRENQKIYELEQQQDKANSVAEVDVMKKVKEVKVVDSVNQAV